METTKQNTPEQQHNLSERTPPANTVSNVGGDAADQEDYPVTGDETETGSDFGINTDAEDDSLNENEDVTSYDDLDDEDLPTDDDAATNENDEDESANDADGNGGYADTTRALDDNP
jgi:hypothetical protein